MPVYTFFQRRHVSGFINGLKIFGGAKLLQLLKGKNSFFLTIYAYAYFLFLIYLSVFFIVIKKHNQRGDKGGGKNCYGNYCYKRVFLNLFHTLIFKKGIKRHKHVVGLKNAVFAFEASVLVGIANRAVVGRDNYRAVKILHQILYILLNLQNLVQSLGA